MSEWIEKKEVLNQIDCWLMTGEYKYSNATHYLDKRISSINPKSEWISVKDRLPEQYEEVLVYSAKYGAQVDWIADKVDNKYFWWNYGELVTHWMPLPEPPKGE